jgi:hypothetical protein
MCHSNVSLQTSLEIRWVLQSSKNLLRLTFQKIVILDWELLSGAFTIITPYIICMAIYG